MNPYKNRNSLINHSNTEKFYSKNISLFNLKLIHKVFNSINISLLILLFTLTFLSLNSQRKWTHIYNNLAKRRAHNNNLIDFISKTEQFYINEIESLKNYKKTTPKDLIYLMKPIKNQKENYFNKKIEFIRNGLKDSRYQRGF